MTPAWAGRGTQTWTWAAGVVIPLGHPLGDAWSLADELAAWAGCDPARRGAAESAARLGGWEALAQLVKATWP